MKNLLSCIYIAGVSVLAFSSIAFSFPVSGCESEDQRCNCHVEQQRCYRNRYENSYIQDDETYKFEDGRVGDRYDMFMDDFIR